MEATVARFQRSKHDRRMIVRLVLGLLATLGPLGLQLAIGQDVSNIHNFNETPPVCDVPFVRGDDLQFPSQDQRKLYRPHVPSWGRSPASNCMLSKQTAPMLVPSEC